MPWKWHNRTHAPASDRCGAGVAACLLRLQLLPNLPGYTDDEGRKRRLIDIASGSTCGAHGQRRNGYTGLLYKGPVQPADPLFSRCTGKCELRHAVPLLGEERSNQPIGNSGRCAQTSLSTPSHNKSGLRSPAVLGSRRPVNDDQVPDRTVQPQRNHFLILG